MQGYTDLKDALYEEEAARIHTKSASQDLKRARDNARIEAVRLAKRAMSADIAFTLKDQFGVIPNLSHINIRFQAVPLSDQWIQAVEQSAPNHTHYFAAAGQEIQISWEVSPATSQISMHTEEGGSPGPLLPSGFAMRHTGSLSVVPKPPETTYVLTVKDPNTSQEKVQRLSLHVARPAPKPPVIEIFQLSPSAISWIHPPVEKQANDKSNLLYYAHRDQELLLSWKISPSESHVFLRSSIGTNASFEDLLDYPPDVEGSLQIRPNAYSTTYLLKAANIEDRSLDVSASATVLVPPPPPFNLRVTPNLQGSNILKWEIADQDLFPNMVFLVEVAIGADVVIEQTGRGGAIKVTAKQWTPLHDEGNDFSTNELRFIHPTGVKRGLFSLKVVRAMYRVCARCGELDSPYSAVEVVECR